MLQQPRTSALHTSFEVCRALVHLHEVGVVQAHRTSALLHAPHQHRASKVCRVLLHSFGVVQAPRTSANLHETHQHRESKLFRVLLR